LSESLIETTSFDVLIVKIGTGGGGRLTPPPHTKLTSRVTLCALPARGGWRGANTHDRIVMKFCTRVHGSRHHPSQF